MISHLVSDLPEIYQPIYGHPGLSGRASRICQDRLEKISQAYDALQRLLGRPLRVLDLGCAQGFFCFCLAERGAIAHGIDYLDKNIAVCNQLAQAHPQLAVSFETCRIEDAINRLEPGQYDLILGLSVFHHIVHEKGIETVRGLLNRAAQNSGVLIVELALHEEPLYWAPSQPKNPYVLLEQIAFIHEVGRHETHLAPILRPLYVASNRYWLLDDLAGQFNDWSSEPHALAQDTHQGSRRYYFSSDFVLKSYRLDSVNEAHNRAEFTQEKLFLQDPPCDFPLPSRTITREYSTEGWLIMSRLPGKLLLDLLREGVKIDHRAILLAVLRQLVSLENTERYHNDVRTWNVLIADDGAVHLIDYGAISFTSQDCVWPGNLFLSFFIFVREVATGIVDEPYPMRTVSISPYALPEPYRTWASSLWSFPIGDWSFHLLHKILLQTPEDISPQPLQQPNEAWIKAIEEAIQLQKMFITQVEARALHAETRAIQAENQLASIVQSKTWQLTAPLRWTIKLFRTLQQKLRRV